MHLLPLFIICFPRHINTFLFTAKPSKRRKRKKRSASEVLQFETMEQHSATALSLPTALPPSTLDIAADGTSQQPLIVAGVEAPLSQTPPKLQLEAQAINNARATTPPQPNKAPTVTAPDVINNQPESKVLTAHEAAPAQLKEAKKSKSKRSKKKKSKSKRGKKNKGGSKRSSRSKRGSKRKHRKSSKREKSKRSVVESTGGTTTLTVDETQASEDEEDIRMKSKKKSKSKRSKREKKSKKEKKSSKLLK